ncbi:hypothetical protein [Bacillus weihaiensis]|uniref:Uncharacterized protein n=1 Tax=Bacillus weihaiensis TaxID=1547283 RepID=A0A1L3MPR4_9BACI|nr:hypothetical protein [Bacillus weihaiensis]APH04336.1 hypothetical protein A9C19_06015 [Bacillus weihaiensis]
MEFYDLLSNPLVWGVLVWLFSRIFSSSKGEENTNQPQRQKEKPEQKKPERSNSRPIPKPVRPASSKERDTSQKPQEKKSLQTVQEVYESMKRNGEEALKNTVQVQVPIEKSRTREVRSIKVEPKPQVNRNISSDPLTIDKNKAAQGLVWSEILGAPRGKNPHFNQRRRQL